MKLRILLAGALLALLAACSVPINLSFDVLGETAFEREGSFIVGEGEFTGPERSGPHQVNIDVDDRVTVNSATLDYRVCFTPADEGISGNLGYALYVAPSNVAANAVFDEQYLVAPSGTVDLENFTPANPLCIEGEVALTAAQVAALNTGSFQIGADITGAAVAGEDIEVSYTVERLTLEISGAGGL